MVFEHVFGIAESVSGWITTAMPTLGCMEVGSFGGFQVGWIAPYIDMNAAAATFVILLGFEAAVFAVRLGIGMYRLIPLIGG